MEDRRRTLTSLALALLLFGAGASQAATPGPSTAAPPQVLTPRAALKAWKLSEAERLLAKKPGAGVAATRWAVMRARLDLMRSRYDAVIKRLEPVVAADPMAYEARVVLGRALQARGEKARAYAVLDQMAEDYNNDVITTGQGLKWLGVGLQLTDYAKNANRAFGEALDLDPTMDDAKLLWAELFEEKYDYGNADRLYLEVLKRQPHSIRATLGRGRIDVKSDRAFAKARERADEVLARSPECVPAHNLIALLALHNERTAEAIQRLTRHSLTLAPGDGEALALLGAAYYLADDTKRYQQTEARALKVNPRFAAFYTTVADHAARMHRYEEAVSLSRSALALDSEHWAAYAQLGIGYSRMGDDDKAAKYLNDAFDGDGFEVRTFNLLSRFYDRAIKRFEWLDVAPMRLRVPRKQKPILSRYVPELLSEAYGFLTKRYRFEPAKPLHIEIFDDPELFAVRSTGLPRLSAHGICFGHVVTSRSPSDGNFNWAEVLWHELSHVYHIQLSKSRVPRWFTEGLAVYESTLGRAAWEREMDGDLLAYRRAGKLRGLADFNLSFTTAKSLKDILVAYYHAFKVAKFIDRTYGFDKMRRMLTLWGQRKPTADVVQAALGVDFGAFDARFFEWLDKDLAYLTKGFTLGSERFEGKADAAYAAADAAPDAVLRQSDAAVAAVAAGDKDKAQHYARRALQLDADDPRALYVCAMLKADAGKKVGAIEDLQRLIALGHDGVRIRTRLAAFARDANDDEGAIVHLERAVALDPKDIKIQHQLVKLLDKAGRPDAAFARRKHLATLDQMNPGLIKRLLDDAATQKASDDDVRLWVEQANHIAPFVAELHVSAARQLARIGDTDKARFEAESALIVDPANADAKAILGP